MFDNKVPKYSMVEVKIRIEKDKEISKNPSTPNATRVLKFDDAGLVITGNYLIVVLDETNVNNTLSSTGKIFNLENVISYKTHNK